MTFDASIALHFGQGFVLPNLVAWLPFWAIWPPVDPSWPLHDFWLQHCTSIQSEVLLIKCDSHRAFFNTLTPVWPWLTPAWHLTQQCTTLQSGFLPTKFGGHRSFLKQLDHGWPLKFCGDTSKICSQTSRAVPFPHVKFQLDTSRHDETHSRTYTQTPLF